MRSSRHVRCGSLLILLLLVVWPSGSQAEDDDSTGFERLQVELIDIASLTRSDEQRVPPRLGILDADAASDQEAPPFGMGWEEGEALHGTADDIIESIRAHVQPGFWEDNAEAGLATVGASTLAVRATDPILAAIHEHLARLQSLQHTTYTLDAVVLAMSSTEASSLTDPRTGAVRTAAGLGPRRIADARYRLRAVAFPDQAVVAWNGHETAYIMDHEVEVATDARVANPVVGVINTGLAIRARMQAIPRTDRVLLRLQSQIVVPQAFGQRGAGSPGAIVTTADTQRVDALLHQLVPADAWVLAASGDDLALLVRVSRRPFAEAARRTGARLEASHHPDESPLSTRMYSVRDLDSATAVRTDYRSLQHTHILPSGYQPREPPELGQPAPKFPTGNLPNLIQETVAPSSWGRRGASIELTKGVLVARNTRPVLVDVERTIDRIRKLYYWSVSTEVHVVEMDAAAAEEILSGPTTLAPDARDALLTDPACRVVETRSVRAPGGVRRALLAGRHRSYVADYEVKIASESTIARPMVQTLFEGLTLIVRGDRTVAGTGAHLAWSFAATEADTPIAQGATPHGLLDLPRLTRTESHGKAQVRFDHTLIANASRTKEGRVRLLLLTPRFVPAPQATAAGGDDPDRSR